MKESDGQNRVHVTEINPCGHRDSVLQRGDLGKARFYKLRHMLEDTDVGRMLSMNSGPSLNYFSDEWKSRLEKERHMTR